MRRVLITVFASLLAVALIAPAAQGATKVRHFQGVDFGIAPGFYPGGLITLDVVFKNKRGDRKKFTPRQLIRIDLKRVALRCEGPPPPMEAWTLLTTTLETKIKLKKSPPPVATKPKVGRYAFGFVHGFTAFTGTISGKIDKVNGRGKPRAHGSFTFEDFDFPGSGPDNCSNSGRTGWSTPRPCRTPNEGGSLPICLESAGLRG